MLDVGVRETTFIHPNGIINTHPLISAKYRCCRAALCHYTASFRPACAHETGIRGQSRPEAGSYFFVLKTGWSCYWFSSMGRVITIWSADASAGSVARIIEISLSGIDGIWGVVVGYGGRGPERICRSIRSRVGGRSREASFSGGSKIRGSLLFVVW